MSGLAKNHAPLARILKVMLDFPAKSILRKWPKTTPLSVDLAEISRTFEVLFDRDAVKIRVGPKNHASLGQFDREGLITAW